jgi:hypothetical protein
MLQVLDPYTYFVCSQLFVIYLVAQVNGLASDVN